MKCAYADPPYFGHAAKHYSQRHRRAKRYDSIDAHAALIRRLLSEFPDGWALSMTEQNLLEFTEKGLLPRERIRLGYWCKTFAPFRPGVNPAFMVEPIVFCGGRRRTRAQPTLKNWVACHAPIRRGCAGAKPAAVCCFIFEFLGLAPGDTLVDLFPGSGAVRRAWREWVSGGRA